MKYGIMGLAALIVTNVCYAKDGDNYVNHISNSATVERVENSDQRDLISIVKENLDEFDYNTEGEEIVSSYSFKAADDHLLGNKSDYEVRLAAIYSPETVKIQPKKFMPMIEDPFAEDNKDMEEPEMETYQLNRVILTVYDLKKEKERYSLTRKPKHLNKEIPPKKIVSEVASHFYKN